MSAYVILLTMNDDVQILKEIEKAVELCEKEYTRSEIFALLEIDSDSHPEKDIEKQICILKLEDIRSAAEADILIHHLTGHHGLIREACAQKINEFFKTQEFSQFFQNKKTYDILTKAVNDINPNICRLIVEILPQVQDKEYFLTKLYERLGVIFEELEKLKRSNWYTKKLFNLYWGLEALNSLCPPCDEQLHYIIEQCLKIREYTIREKTAMLLCSLDETVDFVQKARQELSKDTNYYVLRYAKQWT